MAQGLQGTEKLSQVKLYIIITADGVAADGEATATSFWVSALLSGFFFYETLGSAPVRTKRRQVIMRNLFRNLMGKELSRLLTTSRWRSDVG